VVRLGECAGKKLTGNGGVAWGGEGLGSDLVGGAGELPPAVAVVDGGVGNRPGVAAGVDGAKVVGTGCLERKVGREQGLVQAGLGVIEEGLLLGWLDCGSKLSVNILAGRRKP
jgi:hypothetical protein